MKTHEYQSGVKIYEQAIDTLAKSEQESKAPQYMQADPELEILIEQASCFMKLNQFPELLKVAQDAAEKDAGMDIAVQYK